MMQLLSSCFLLVTLLLWLPDQAPVCPLQIHAGGSVLFSDLQSGGRAFVRWARKNLEGGV